MKYVPPYGVTANPDASYVNGDPSIGRQGSIPPAAVFENPQREIVNLIADSTQSPADTDLHQLTRGVRDGKLNFCIDSGPLNDLQVTLFGPPVQAYTAGLTLRVLVAHTNTGPTRITVGTLNPTTVKRRDGSELQANDILAGMVATLVCDGTYFQLQNMGPGDGSGGGDTSIYSIDIPYVHDTGTANHLIGLYSPPLVDIREGRTVEIKLLNNVTGPTDFTPNNFPTHPVAHPDGSPLKAGDGVINQIFLLCFDGTQWQLLGVYFSTVPAPGPTAGSGKSVTMIYQSTSSNSGLIRTPSLNTNRQVWTTSFFVKRTSINSDGSLHGQPNGSQMFFGAGNAGMGGDFTGYEFSDNYNYATQPEFWIFWNNAMTQIAGPGNAYNARHGTVNLPCMDDLNWHHVCGSSDGATFNMVVDGILVSQGATGGINGRVNSTTLHFFGGNSGLIYGTSAKMAEIYLIDGSAQTWDKFASNIGGIFKPKVYTGPFGTNGCYLNFSDSSATTATTLGKDWSGNNNNWQPVNIAISQVTSDFPG